MPYTFTVIQAQVRLKIGDTSADVTQPIDDAINFLSNFFSLQKLVSVSTVANQSYIAKSGTLANLFELDRLKINSLEYKKIGLAGLAQAEADGGNYFYDYNDQVQIVPTPTSILSGQAWGRFAFTPLAGAGSSDVPDRLVPLVVILASWFYYLGVLSNVSVARQKFPDVTPDEAGKIVSEVKKQFDTMLDTIKKYFV
jgi:hypothetical protein